MGKNKDTFTKKSKLIIGILLVVLFILALSDCSNNRTVVRQNKKISNLEMLINNYKNDSISLNKELNFYIKMDSINKQMLSERQNIIEGLVNKKNTIQIRNVIPENK